ncbi:MAG: hypothetical protein K8T26_09050 [Lentisphaerae bacterium]|nr:hypothetical protein [Lentisphaerota bacterium]
MHHRLMFVRENLLALALALAGAACVPVFTNPPPPDPKPDPALLGTWTSDRSDKDPSQVSFFARQDGGVDIIHLTEIDGTSDKGAGASIYEGYTATVGPDHVLCFRGRDEKTKAGEAQPYLMARYRIGTPDQLEVQLFLSEAVRTMIESGQLQGTITEEEHMPDSITVTSAAPAFVDAMLKSGADAFVSSNDVMRFVRLRAATP